MVSKLTHCANVLVGSGVKGKVNCYRVRDKCKNRSFLSFIQMCTMTFWKKRTNCDGVMSVLCPFSKLFRHLIEQMGCMQKMRKRVFVSLVLQTLTVCLEHINQKGKLPHFFFSVVWNVKEWGKNVIRTNCVLGEKEKEKVSYIIKFLIILFLYK